VCAKIREETRLTPDYTDAKGRPRWHANDQLAEKLKNLHDLLVIGGYPPDHAARYPKLGYAISRFPEPIGTVAAEGRLRSIPGIGPTVEKIVVELVETGDCAKMREPSDGYVPPPRTVLELTAFPGLGAKIARELYAQRGIASAAQLKESEADGALDGFPGIGPKLRAAIRAL
jgi:DNA polymerase (family 10)